MPEENDMYDDFSDWYFQEFKWLPLYLTTDTQVRIERIREWRAWRAAVKLTTERLTKK